MHNEYLLLSCQVSLLYPDQIYYIFICVEIQSLVSWRIQCCLLDDGSFPINNRIIKDLFIDIIYMKNRGLHVNKTELRMDHGLGIWLWLLLMEKIPLTPCNTQAC